MILLVSKKYLNVPTYIWGLFLFCVAIFIFFPQIDLFVASQFFYNTHFALKESLFETIFFQSIAIVVTTTALLSLSIFSYNFLLKKNFLGINKRVILYIVLVLAIAPGLIVNNLLKEHWGRARPNQIEQFGGDKKFTPAFIISSQNGNSFSSGHSAAAFSMIGIAFLATKRRKFWITLAITYGILVSIARIIAGGHFLSDTVSSFFIVYITTLMLYGWLIKEKE